MLLSKHFTLSALKRRAEVSAYWSETEERRKMTEKYTHAFGMGFARRISLNSLALARKVKEQLGFEEVFPAVFKGALLVRDRRGNTYFIGLHDPRVLTYARRRIILFRNRNEDIDFVFEP